MQYLLNLVCQSLSYLLKNELGNTFIYAYICMRMYLFVNIII